MNRTFSELTHFIVSGIFLFVWIFLLWRGGLNHDDWVLYVYAALIVVTYFSLLWSLSKHLSVMKPGVETFAVILFLLAAFLLVLVFGFGWAVFGNFSGAHGYSLTKVDPYYFSVVAFTTLGFGDFAPNNDAGKIFLSIEALMGITHTVAFFSIVISRIISK